MAGVGLFYVVHCLVTRHLRTFAKYVDDTDVNNTSLNLRLNRTTGTVPDDLDCIVGAIHNFEQRANTSLSQLRLAVDERIKSKQKAHETLSIRSSFIGTMSHEVRTPLNAILSFLHLIETAETVPEKQRNHAQVATKAAQQLHNQLTNILDMSALIPTLLASKPAELISRDWPNNGRRPRPQQFNIIENPST